MPYYMLAKQKMGFVNNTQVVTTFDFSYVSAHVSNTIFDNSHFAHIAPRNRLHYYQYGGSFQTFNSYYSDLFDNPLGANPIYLAAYLRLNP